MHRTPSAWNCPDQYGGIATSFRRGRPREHDALGTALICTVGLRFDFPIERLAVDALLAWNCPELYGGIATNCSRRWPSTRPWLRRNFPNQYGGIATGGPPPACHGSRGQVGTSLISTVGLRLLEPGGAALPALGLGTALICDLYGGIATFPARGSRLQPRWLGTALICTVGLRLRFASAVFHDQRHGGTSLIYTVGLRHRAPEVGQVGVRVLGTTLICTVGLRHLLDVDVEVGPLVPLELP